MTCARCGATLPSNASWCGLCHEQVGAVVPARHVAVQAATAAPVYSRWRKSATSFGPVGRVSWTVGVVAVGALTVFSQNPFAIGIWWLIAVPLVMRSVWARSRVS